MGGVRLPKRGCLLLERTTAARIAWLLQKVENPGQYADPCSLRLLALLSSVSGDRQEARRQVGLEREEGESSEEKGRNKALETHRLGEGPQPYRSVDCWFRSMLAQAANKEEKEVVLAKRACCKTRL